MSIFALHNEGDCWPDNCPICREDDAHEATHDLTKERECRRCGMTEHDNEIRDNDCIDESLTVVARPGLEVDTVYVNPDGSAFWTPDGVGCFFFDSEDEAFDEAEADDDWEIVHLDRRFDQ